MTLDAVAHTMRQPPIFFAFRPKVFGEALVDELEEDGFFVIGTGVVLWVGSIT